MNKILIYESSDHKAQVEVKLDNDTVWLNQKDMAALFGIQRPAVTKHLSNIFKSGELNENSVSSILEHTAQDGKRYQTSFYNLDAIISIGYRVNSAKATQFRIWATKVLKEHLIQGYTLNEKQLKKSEEKYSDLKKAVELITRTLDAKKIGSEEATGILKILKEYSHALEILDKYDHQKLEIPDGKRLKLIKLTYDEAIKQVKVWSDSQNAGRLFGNEKDESFKSSINTIYQTFNGKELYPSLAEKAAHLLYFIVKNHSFSDGNKRIAAGLFVYFLDLNKSLFRPNGSKILDDNALVALTLLIAESKPEEKDMMVKVVVNLML
jgi:prophage maintenance system killer protein/prophage antirepressor-like protein